jgi:L-cysteine desulfidase
LPERIDATVSPNVFKSGVSVGVPGTGRRGLAVAAALGAVLDRVELGLAILDTVNDEALQQAEALSSLVTVRDRPFPDPLTILAEVSAGAERASVTIANDYCHIIEINRNGSVLYRALATRTAQTGLAYWEGLSMKPSSGWADSTILG